MSKPLHFKDMSHFRAYILECAIRDRESFLHALGDFDEDIKRETQAEILAMKVLFKRALEVYRAKKIK